ncbi:uncharacterized protein LOC143292353 [Babylonia areolata]|uniref:uncharacterized protein LOC143292353 n=1 Tax=Babylonia areolata TaxID=304850 RepID=UPI003FD59CCB
MALEVAILLLLTLSVTSHSSRNGDLLQAACKEACRDWESLRKQCVVRRCQGLRQDWFPCFLSCWEQSRPCLALCADSFWKSYSPCSRQCLRRTGKKKWRCRHRCAVRVFKVARKKLVVPTIPRIAVTVDRQETR